jgi:chemotaxis protein methyltransferase CheR
VALPVDAATDAAGHRLAAEQLELEALELRLLLEGVYRHYGYDFREYALASLRRRVSRRVREEQLGSITALTDRVLHDPACMARLLGDLSINVTSMFRDPQFYVAFAKHVVPQLRTYPFTRIWVAGCSTGEEVYSLAILLTEHDLYERSRIYATDINQLVLEQAREGVYPLDRMQEYTENYIQAGGKHAFSEYYVAAYDGALFDAALRENIVWAQHNLAQDGSFNEFHVIVCRNVLIYFDKTLQNRVHRLFYESLVRFGTLCLGNRESVRFSAYEGSYQEVEAEARLFRRIK